MIRLARLYICSHWRRDLSMTAISASISLLIILCYSPSHARYVGLWWIFTCVAYTAFTSLRGYFDAEQCISPLLLPVGESTKFAFTALRTLVIFPILSYGVMLAPLYILDHNTFLNIARLPFRTHLPLYHLPVVSYFLVWFCSLGLLFTTFSPKWRWIAGVTLGIIAAGSVSVLDVAGALSYPFIGTDVNIWTNGVEWHSVCSWTGLPVKVQYAVSYIWLLLLPVAAIAISYFRFREIRFERWN